MAGPRMMEDGGRVKPYAASEQPARKNGLDEFEADARAAGRANALQGTACRERGEVRGESAEE